MSALKKILMMANQAEEENLLPEGYVECEWLYSDGKCYIPTGISGDDIIVEAVLQADRHTNAYMAPFGAHCDYMGYSLFHYSNGGWGLASANKFSYNGERIQIRAVLSISKEFSIECSMNDTLDGKYAETLKQQTNTFRQNVGFNIFSPRAAAASDAFVGWLWYFNVFDFNGNLLYRYVPALRLDGTPGLYDTVNGSFLLNRGSGNLTYKLK